MGNKKLRKEYMAVACDDASGMPDIVCVEVDVTQECYDMGDHYDSALECVSASGYEVANHKCFDNSEHDAILNAARNILEWRKDHGMPLLDKDDTTKFAELLGLDFKPEDEFDGDQIVDDLELVVEGVDSSSLLYRRCKAGIARLRQLIA